MKKKKINLTLDPQLQDLPTIIGISSHEKGYTLSWMLNKNLGTSFSRSSDIEENRPDHEEKLVFPVYSYRDETRKISLFLIQNRTPEGFLIRERTTIDYFLVIPELFEYTYGDTLLQQLKSVQGIQTAFIVDPEEIQHPERIIPE